MSSCHMLTGACCDVGVGLLFKVIGYVCFFPLESVMCLRSVFYVYFLELLVNYFSLPVQLIAKKNLSPKTCYVSSEH